MTDHERGRIDTSAAEVYDSLFVPALFGRFAQAVADVADVALSDTVIDIACGTGALTRALRARTDGRVVGVDVNPAMLAVARRHGGAIDYIEGDAIDLGFEDGVFDLATSQFGLMFYPDPVAGVREMNRIAHRGVVAVWDSIERSSGYRAMQELLRDQLGEDAAASLDAPFAMGAPGRLEDVLAEAGAAAPSFQSIRGSGRFGSIGQWVTTEVRGWTLGDSVPDDVLEELIEVARDRLADFETNDGVVFDLSAKVGVWGSAGAS